ncbi:hypothetical protein BD809_103158 [Aquimarina intermedia]|uniref:Uncharacterized protein n=1 Tax=Aquimarina intermedia TaxID=350814 RepID=A0A5S5C6Q3_9FLAO|nr:hypothetical protein BD809_103158 [Aquimarina intermedia]
MRLKICYVVRMEHTGCLTHSREDDHNTYNFLKRQKNIVLNKEYIAIRYFIDKNLENHRINRKRRNQEADK